MDRNNDDTPVLVGQSGPLNGQRWMVRNNIIVGRDMECDIIIPSRQVSRRHARLTVTESGAILEDLGSKNGFRINGQEETGDMYSAIEGWRCSSNRLRSAVHFSQFRRNNAA